MEMGQGRTGDEKTRSAMFALKRGWCWAGLLAVIALAVATPGAWAGGWLGYRNDLGHPVVLQATTDKGQPGKPLTLQPGESTCDWVNDTAARKIVVLDGRERPPKSELVRFEAATTEKGDVLFIVRMVTRENKKFIEVVKTTDTGRKKK